MTLDPITVTVVNFQAGADTISGTAVLSQDSETAYSLDVDFVINGEDLDGVFIVEIVEDDYGNAITTVNTQGTMLIMGYELQAIDVVFDPEVCEDYPISGSIVTTKDGESDTITFTDECKEPVLE